MSGDYDDLVRQVEAQRDHYETLVRIATGCYPDDADRTEWEWLADAYGAEDLAEAGGDELAEFAQERLNEDVLSIQGIWKGTSREDADYVGCEVAVCVGGPHVELDTVRLQWVGHWGGDKVYRSAGAGVCAYFDEMVAQ